ncbi:MAG: tRNA 2-thiouridine(34) synthase MnmA [Anaerolineaceae bacterium 4572_78]|nr:MAG: tRNA 2-thiouridine(34) synthase MnmA [Anaerolineaceae bacterium 4572_78]
MNLDENQTVVIHPTEPDGIGGFSYLAFDIDNSCCTTESISDAELVADILGIPFYVRDYKAIFKETVVDNFIDNYKNALTPNPCLICNRHIRFGTFLDEAMTMGAEYFATGHYARIKQNEQGKYELWRGVDKSKDQSYVLHALNQENLPHILFPLGEYSKDEARQIGKRYKLPVFEKADSQDLCFLGDDGQRGFIRRHAPHILKAGDIVNTKGEVLGQHIGLAAYTVGQRKGLGIIAREKMYVIKLNPIKNQLVIGTRNELGSDELTAHSVTYISGCPLTEPTHVEGKIRYKSRLVPAMVTSLPNKRLHAKFEMPLPDITPGQGFVFYHGDKVLGGGTIERPCSISR